MVACVLDQHWTIEQTAERFQVDAKTVRKWRDRFLAEGDDGLLDRSSRPHRSPNQTRPTLRNKVLRLRRRHRWGADHIHAHWAHLTATIAMGASAVSGIPWSFTAHRYDIFLNNLLTQKLRSARFGRFIAQDMLAEARPLVTPDALARALAHADL